MFSSARKNGPVRIARSAGRFTGLALLTLVVAVSGCAAPADTAPPAVSPDSVRGVTLAGDPLTVHFTQQPTLFVFWASWCGHCRSEMPDVIDFAQQQRGEVQVCGINVGEVQVCGINVDRDLAAARAVVREEQPPYVSLHDPQLRIADRWDVDGVPALIWIEDGEVSQFRSLHELPVEAKEDAR